MAGTQLLMGPERLGDVADVVLVAINYRVGPLGKRICKMKIFLLVHPKIGSSLLFLSATKKV